MFNNLKKLSMVAGLILCSISASFAEGPVEVYGEMKVKGQYFVGSKDKYQNAIVQVKGLSFFWNNWGGDAYWNEGEVNNMIDNYGAEMLRVPVTTSSNGKYADLSAARAVIDQCIKRGIYIIIDYHSHQAWNEVDEAKNFFKQAVEWYGDKDNVIFEIFNEPDTHEPHEWAGVKQYADQLVAHIRGLGSDNLIVVGTPCFGQVFEGIKENPVIDPLNNTAYVMHFYSYSHHVDDDWTGKNFKAALEDGLPFMVTEWGTSHFNGGQDGSSFDGNSADQWHALLDEYGFSSAMWSIFSHHQSSALWGNTGATDGYIKGLLENWKGRADWRNGTVRPIPGMLEVTLNDIEISMPVTSVTLDASISGGKEPFKYKWELSAGEDVDVQDMMAASTVVEGLSEGLYSFSLRVTDAQGTVITQKLTVTVKPNTPPIDDVSSSSNESSSNDDESSSSLVSSSISKGKGGKDPLSSSSVSENDIDDGIAPIVTVVRGAHFDLTAEMNRIMIRSESQAAYLVQVMNHLGQVVQTMHVSMSGSEAIDLSHLVSGLYLVQVQGGGAQQTIGVSVW